MAKRRSLRYVGRLERELARCLYLLSACGWTRAEKCPHPNASQDAWWDERHGGRLFTTTAAAAKHAAMVREALPVDSWRERLEQAEQENRDLRDQVERLMEEKYAPKQEARHAD